MTSAGSTTKPRCEQLAWECFAKADEWLSHADTWDATATRILESKPKPNEIEDAARTAVFFRNESDWAKFKAQDAEDQGVIWLARALGIYRP